MYKFIIKDTFLYHICLTDTNLYIIIMSSNKGEKLCHQCAKTPIFRAAQCTYVHDGKQKEKAGRRQA